MKTLLCHRDTEFGNDEEIGVAENEVRGPGGLKFDDHDSFYLASHARGTGQKGKKELLY